MIEGRVVVARRGADRIRRGHPWVFRSDVVRAEQIPDGAVVALEDSRGRPLGHAFYSSRSEIRLRVLEAGEQPLAASFLGDRLEAALAWRERVAPGATALRLVHGEGDRLPSLIVDRYGAHLVVQTLSQASERLKPQLVEWLVARLGPAGILERNDPKARALEGLERKVGLLHGEVPERVEVEEGGLRFGVDLWRGQKTGLFLDQRENHALARRYTGARVLDAFSYNGGFALQAAAAGAREVLALDVSPEAVATIQANATLNALTGVRVEECNVFDRLRELDEAGERFELVVLDPPAFAKSKAAVDKARGGYKQINLRALRLLAPGGCLITCSCSYHINEAEFEQILWAAASDVGATVSVVEKRRQGRDHPVLLGVPETYYLKCFVLRRLA